MLEAKTIRRRQDAHERAIAEDLMIVPGCGATYHVGSDAYPYYVSEVFPNGVVGIYSPKSHFKSSWTEGSMVVDSYDASHPTDQYIRRSYGKWWKCDKNGRRISKFGWLTFGYAVSYQDPSF